MAESFVLIDSSAWIATLRRQSVTERSIQTVFENANTAGVISTASPIKLELLQGAKTQREYSDLQWMLNSLHQLQTTEAVWARAYALGFALRRNGFTIPTPDILIAALALEYDCALLHPDRHFR